LAQDTIGIAGAGLAGAVLAREIADHSEFRCVVFDERDHIAGNCHTQRDEETGVMVHEYGPHIFHTVHDHVWSYLNRFARFGPYTHRVKALTSRGIFGLPINLLTINQFFGKTFSPQEAQTFVAGLGDLRFKNPQTFEEQALRLVGSELYEAFFKGYTMKQWGRNPNELPASILKRLPIRFTYEDNYYLSRHSGIPLEGYTEMVRRILDHEQIEVRVGERVPPEARGEFRHLFWSGTVDGFFHEALGRLRYRTLKWERHYQEGDFQGTSQMNYCDPGVPQTRITEHKFFAPWEEHARTVFFVEYADESQPGDIPYYPLALQSDLELFNGYAAMAADIRDVSFIGRLGTYRYLDMDAVVHEMLAYSKRVLAALLENDGRPPVFSS
jgi:UDP-galactopyranose mutase